VLCFIFSTVVLWQEIEAVNRKLSKEEQFSHLGMYTSKRLGIKKEYARLYPKSWLDQIQWSFEIAGFVFLLLAAVKAGFFRFWLGS